MYLIVKLILTLPVIPCALGRNLPMKEPKSLVYEDFFSGSHLLLVMEFRVFRRPPVFKLEFGPFTAMGWGQFASFTKKASSFSMAEKISDGFSSVNLFEKVMRPNWATACFLKFEMLIWRGEGLIYPWNFLADKFYDLLECFNSF